MTFLPCISGDRRWRFRLQVVQLGAYSACFRPQCRHTVTYPLRADRWWTTPGCPGVLDEDDGRCLGIRCNIWARARRRSEITHKLWGGSNHQIGWGAEPGALMWQDMVSTDEVCIGVHPFLRYLPKKMANFLHEYYSEHFPSLNLPPLPSDWSQIDVHAMLEPFDIQRLLRRLQV